MPDVRQTPAEARDTQDAKDVRDQQNRLFNSAMEGSTPSNSRRTTAADVGQNPDINAMLGSNSPNPFVITNGNEILAAGPKLPTENYNQAPSEPPKTPTDATPPTTSPVPTGDLPQNPLAPVTPSSPSTPG